MDKNNDLNEVVLNKLKLRIFHMVHENYKTKKLSYSVLNEKIRKTIEAVVENDN